MEMIERFKGCLLGLAAGDALGTTVEFSLPGSFKPIDDIVGGGVFNLEPGQWTDDTSMALCLAESLVEKDGFDPLDQVERCIRWRDEGYLSSNGTCFDIGGTVSSSLRTFEATGDPLSGSTERMSAGNGSIMRLAPVPLFFSPDPEEAIEMSAESSRTTHGVAVAVDACRYLGALIVGSLMGADKEELLSERYSPVPSYWERRPLAPEIDEIASGSFKRKEPPEIKGTGYVVESLEAALWAFDKGDSFREGCLLAVNLGDDADTTGAVFGQLAGAYFGEAGLPGSWVEKVALREKILSLVEGLYSRAREDTGH